MARKRLGAIRVGDVRRERSRDFRFRQNDGVVLGAMVSELACLFVILFCGKISYRYFPSIRGEITDVFSIVFYAVYALFLLTPLIINVREGIRWKRSRSKI